MSEVTSALNLPIPFHKAPSFGNRRNQFVTVSSEWTIQHFLFHEAKNKLLKSPEFSAKQHPDLKWKLKLHLDEAHTDSYNFSCCLNSNSRDSGKAFLLKTAIINKKSERVHLREDKIPKSLSRGFCVPLVDKNKLWSKSNELLLNGGLTIFCEIHFVLPIKKSLSSSSIFQHDLFRSNDPLSYNIEELFQNTKFSDVTIDVQGQTFPAHKCIMAFRSKIFAAMFDHLPTQEKMSDHLEVADVEPDVFLEVLRFIYRGNVDLSQMGEKKTVGLLIAADKYLLESLKCQCETQLIDLISIENCAYFLSLADCHGALCLKQNALEFFRCFPSEVIATDAWKKLHPVF